MVRLRIDPSDEIALIWLAGKHVKRVAPGTTLLCISMSSIPAMLACSQVDVLARERGNRHSRCYVTAQRVRNNLYQSESACK